MLNKNNLIGCTEMGKRIQYLFLVSIYFLIHFSCIHPKTNPEAISFEKSSILSQEAFLNRMTPHFKQSGALYQKYKRIYARKALENEKIRTITNDGLETTNTAKKGDFVVKNQTGAQEMYIVTKEAFYKRYRLLKEDGGEFSEYQSIGKVIGVELTPSLLNRLGFKTEFEFVAPWGEKMVAKKGDYIVSPPEQNEVYRIARKEFFETYQLEE